jgi:hypothetical protein
MFSSLLGDTKDLTLRKYQGEIDDLLSDVELVAERLKIINPDDAISCKDKQLQVAREIAFKLLREQHHHNKTDDDHLVKSDRDAYLSGQYDHVHAIQAILEYIKQSDSTRIPDTSERLKAIKFTYTNYRGETSVRNAIVFGTRWGETDWHPEPGMLMTAFDLDKFEIREFALKDCDFTSGETAFRAGFEDGADWQATHERGNPSSAVGIDEAFQAYKQSGGTS